MVRRRERGHSPWRALWDFVGSGPGISGLMGGGLVWVLSVVALGMGMQANLAADGRGHPPFPPGAELLIRHLHGAALAWSICFSALQVGSLLTFAFVLRASFRFRSAICFSAGAGIVMAGDLLGLLGLLVWVGSNLDPQ